MKSVQFYMSYIKKREQKNAEEPGLWTDETDGEKRETKSEPSVSQMLPN